MVFLDEGFRPVTVEYYSDDYVYPVGVYQVKDRYVVHNFTGHMPDEYGVTVLDSDGNPTEINQHGQLLWLNPEGIGLTYRDEVWIKTGEGKYDWDTKEVGILALTNFLTGEKIGEAKIGYGSFAVGPDGRIYGRVFDDKDLGGAFVRGGTGKDMLKFEPFEPVNSWHKVDGLYMPGWFGFFADGRLAVDVNLRDKVFSGQDMNLEKSGRLVAVIDNKGVRFIDGPEGQTYDDWNWKDSLPEKDKFRLTGRLINPEVLVPIEGNSGLFENEVLLVSQESVKINLGGSITLTTSTGKRYEVVVGAQPNRGWEKGIEHYRQEAGDGQEMMYVKFHRGGVVQFGSLSTIHKEGIPNIVGSVQLVGVEVRKTEK
jgi:hypothetical protein